MLQLYPGAQLLLAGDANVYLSEVMDAGRERSCEAQLRVVICAFLNDFGLAILNPVRVSTHRSGSSIDLVLASRSLDVRKVVVHDGYSCGCPSTCCHPALGSDHQLITFDVMVKPAVVSKVPRWPRVRDWPAVLRAMRPDLLRWASRVVRLRNECDAASNVSKQAVVDILCGEFVALMWSLPRQTVRNTQALRRPQPDWWDPECYDLMVSRNAAYRLWRRERTPAARAAFRAKRRFHHFVRRKKAQFWNTWLRAQEQLAGDNPRMAAQNIRQQMGMRRHVLPCAMRSSDFCGGLVEGPACLDAWRAHFRDVPLNARPTVVSPGKFAADVEGAVQQLRASMPSNVGHLDFPLSEAELTQVLQELPAQMVCLMKHFGLTIHACAPRCWCFLSLFGPGRSSLLCGAQPLLRLSTRVAPTCRPISLLCSCQKVFERLVLKRLLPHIDPLLVPVGG